MYVKFNSSLAESKANSLVKEQLIEHGYSEDLEIVSFPSDDNINYWILDNYFYKGKNFKKITILTDKTYNQLLVNRLSKSSDSTYQVFSIVNDGKVKYMVSELSYSKKVLRKRRGK